MNQELNALADRYWEAILRSEPTMASIIVGDHRFDDQVEDFSRAAEETLAAELEAIVSSAEAIEPDLLDEADLITRSSLIAEAAGGAAALRTRRPEWLVDPMIGPHIDMISYVPQLTPTGDEHAAAFVTKARRMEKLFAQAIDRLREGVASGRTPVHTLVTKSVGQLDDYLRLPIADDPWLQIKPPPTMDEAAVAAWRDAMADAVQSTLRPAIARYRKAISDEVLPAARPDDKPGVCWLPDGEQIYDAARRRYTSLDLDAETIHQIGLDEMDGLAGEYRELGEQVLGTTDLTELYERLRTDPSLRFETSEQVIAQAERAMQRANEATPEWFGRLPASPCVVEAVPEVGAQDAPLAYYLPPAQDGTRPGVIFVNTTAPTSRTRYESEALAFHEGVPGHHLQLAIAQEVEGLPLFRRHSAQTAYVEGWGLYTERLGDEMGLYSGDLERFGILSFDSWRAGRLVVDTGMHALGWTRQQAIDYLAANSPQAPNNIINEVDRYIGYHGQALAYKIGQREILQARARAEAALGAQFDIKRFHDVVLEAGPVPLPVLGEIVDRWSAAGG